MGPGARGGAGVLTSCARRQRRGPGAAVAEEERCAVERRADLSYSEFVQQYVPPPRSADIAPFLARPSSLTSQDLFELTRGGWSGQARVRLGRDSCPF